MKTYNNYQLRRFSYFQLYVILGPEKSKNCKLLQDFGYKQHFFGKKTTIFWHFDFLMMNIKILGTLLSVRKYFIENL